MAEDLAAQLAVELRRTVDRLRSMALTRLEAPYAPEPTRVIAARDVAQRMADHAAAMEGIPAVWRDLPHVPAAAAGDLLAVTGHDLVAAYDDPARTVTTRDGVTTTADLLVAQDAAELRDLRTRL